MSGNHGPKVTAALLMSFFLLFAQPARSQQIVYDRYIKVKLPADWTEKRSWELGDDRSIPLYNSSLAAVAFVWGFDIPLYHPSYVKTVAENGRLKQRIEFDLSAWPAEASRYYAMVSSGYRVRATPKVVTVGPSFKPAQVRYLGQVKIGNAQLELAEYFTDEVVSPDFAAKYKLRAEFIGSKVQILFGQAVFGKKHGYTLTACRFASAPDVELLAAEPAKSNIEWIRPLLENIEQVSKTEQANATAAEHQRDMVSHALAMTRAQEHPYELALEQLQAVLAANPDDDNALAVKGEILLEQSNLEAAEKTLRQAVAINPTNDRANFALASTLWRENKRDEALAGLDLVQKISPLYPGIDLVLMEKRAAHPVAAAAQPLKAPADH